MLHQWIANDKLVMTRGFSQHFTHTYLRLCCISGVDSKSMRIFAENQDNIRRSGLYTMTAGQSVGVKSDASILRAQPKSKFTGKASQKDSVE